jgi:hypothetical protein
VVDFNPNTTNLGPGTSRDEVPRWFYYFEVLVNIGNLNTRSGWTFNQKTKYPRGYYILDLGNGRTGRVNYPARVDPRDGPDPNERQWSFFGYLWIDAPSFASTQVWPDDGRRYPVIGGGIRVEIEFTAENSISRATCSKSLTLTLEVTRSGPDWTPQ